MKTAPIKPKKVIEKTPPIGLEKKYTFKRFAKISFWFFLGVILGFVFLISFLYTGYKTSHNDRVYDGVTVNNIDFGGKTKEEVRSYFAKKNKVFDKTLITLASSSRTATTSAKQIGYGFDENLIATQTYSIGRSGNIISDMSIILQAYIGGINLTPAIHYRESEIDKVIIPFSKDINIDPVDALFNFDGKRVIAFKPSSNGKAVDGLNLKKQILSDLQSITHSGKAKMFAINVPVIDIQPKITTEKVNSLGIKELIAEGTSLFAHSIENRIYNVNLAASRINGALIKPGETFSFAKTVGDVTSLTGYKQAYVIENGKTVLGDGGGVCQVSTTLFRAALNAGLPIVERNQHAYRVGYYEEDSPPGIDAAVYIPSVDLKFKNDTDHYILVQTVIDLEALRLTFQLFGTKDNRIVTVNKPVILSQSPAPPDEYQDDPTLPKGQIKQIDFSAGGMNVYFTRTVTKDGKVLDDDKFTSNYRPWRAVYLRGTM
ncbi:MAG TPA: VanW family protein [Candidatus Saccharimonadales bacterium]|nr:VanW family protein [Candidatus Saccharimonadales bacterium]